MKIKVTLLALILLLFGFDALEARVDPDKLKKLREQAKKISGSRSDCQPSQAQYDLEINNVRAKLLAGGDMWWDLQNGSYIVPKPAPGFPEVSAIFATGLWIGGMDPNGALKLAGVTYRSGNATDFYPGPLDENGETNAEVCNDWDRHFVVKGDNIRSHRAYYEESVANNEPYPCESIPDDVKYWPARGNPFFNEEYDFELPDQSMADFWDEDGDGIYNPCEGDYPIVTTRGCGETQVPDEIVFWTFNDNGGPHRLSQATPMQIEVQANAFAYQAQNEINDMTFYRFEIINKATDDIRDCYFGLWVDPDLGCSEDDYVGCDVERSMAYIYNEDSVDGSPGSACPGGINTYGNEIPMVGVDLFRGPRGPKVFCGVDDEGNTILCDPTPGTGEQDTIVELGMTSFTYQNRGVSNPPEATTDPDIDFEFYNILKGFWKDGSAITFGNTGFDPASADSTKYVFPSSPNDPTGWSMCTADLPFDDRRTVQSTGPLLLQPGARNEMVFGVVYVPNVNHPCPAIEKLQFADDLAQSLFDGCFEAMPTPDAPDMAGIELDREIILLLSNDPSPLETNNAKEQFMEIDLKAPSEANDPYYRFEGYKIYQLANANVKRNELDDVDKARIIRQCDIKNGVDEIYNWFPVANPDPSGPAIWVPERQVIGSDQGIQHSFQIKKDLFADGDQKLQNGKKYYYTVLAYAYNNWKQYSPIEYFGQRTPYIESVRNVRIYNYTPRPLLDIEIPTAYGDEVAVTRIDGKGTSFNALDMEDGEIESILDGSFDGEITYKAGNSPINPKVVNPLGVKDGRYRLEIKGDYDDAPSQLKFEEGAYWELTDLETGEVIASDKTIEEINEQIIHGKGFSIQVNQVGAPGDQFNEQNGAIAQVFEYEDNTGIDWWNAVPAYSGLEVEGQDGDIQYVYRFVEEEDTEDPTNELSRIDAGQFIPFRTARWTPSDIPYITPGWKQNQGFAIAQDKLRFQHLNNVDIIMTPDKTKWSKCIVVESAVEDYVESGVATLDGTTQFDLRSSQSIDQNGNAISGETGMSYFPGYAIDVETGERLNIFFGENSVYRTENDEAISQATGQMINTENIGADMVWNPSTALFAGEDPLNSTIGSYASLAGGQHYIYVTRQEYDGCQALSEQLGQGGLLNKINAVSFITWTAIPTPKEPLLSMAEGLIRNDLTIKLRVTSPFNKEIDVKSYTNPTGFEAVGGLPVYEFGFEGVEITGSVATEEIEPLQDVVIFPNPYYDSGAPVQGQSDNVVQIDNLPKGAIVTVFTLDGKFVKRFSEDVGTQFKETGSTRKLEWNLQDNNGMKLSSGIYIIHISVPHLGIQKSLKWIKG